MAAKAAKYSSDIKWPMFAGLLQGGESLEGKVLRRAHLCI
jgi:hypothetical protein